MKVKANFNVGIELDIPFDDYNKLQMSALRRVAKNGTRYYYYESLPEALNEKFINNGEIVDYSRGKIEQNEFLRIENELLKSGYQRDDMGYSNDVNMCKQIHKDSVLNDRIWRSVFGTPFRKYPKDYWDENQGANND